MDQKTWLSSNEPGKLIGWVVDRSLPHPPGWVFRSESPTLIDDAVIALANRSFPDLEQGEGVAQIWQGSPGLVASIIREIIGNPFLDQCPICKGKKTRTMGGTPAPNFSPPLTHTCDECKGTGRLPLWPAVQSWRERLARNEAVSIAEKVGMDGDFAALPVLADALQEAGVTDRDILEHCRGRERCWTCLGTGEETIQEHVPDPPWRRSFIPQYKTKTTLCSTCGGVCWLPLRGPHVRGCWLISRIMEQINA